MKPLQLMDLIASTIPTYEKGSQVVKDLEKLRDGVKVTNLDTERVSAAEAKRIRKNIRNKRRVPI